MRLRGYLRAALWLLACGGCHGNGSLFATSPGDAGPASTTTAGATPDTPATLVATTRIEAEDYNRTSAPLTLATSADPLFGGRVISAAEANTLVTYTLTAATAGTYAINLRLSVPDANATVRLWVDGEALGAGPPIGSTGAGSVFIDYGVRNVVLAQGAQTLTVALNADGLLLDWIDLLAHDPPAVATPAEVFWSNMDQAAIAANVSQWSFVAAHLDGIEWGTSNLAQLQTVGTAISPDAVIALSSGGLGAFTGNVPATWATALASQINQAVATVQNTAHVAVRRVHINQDPFAPLQALAQAAPTDSNVQLGNAFADAMAAVTNGVHAADANIETSMFLGTPVATTWQYMAAFNGPGVATTLSSPAATFFFDTYPILNRYYAATPAASGGYITDSPAEYFDAGGATYQAKLLSYERWLHGIGKRHTLITDRYNCSSTTDAQADACYYQAIQNYLHTYQSHGGRADTYMIFELHNGPVDTLPETTANTFANTVMDAIKYLKGTGETLDLALQGNSGAAVGAGIAQAVPDTGQTLSVTLGAGTQQNFVVRLRNTGDVTAMPVLRAVLSGSASVVPTVQAGNADVTYDVLRGAGYVCTQLVAPGATGAFNLVLAAPSGATGGTLTLILQALWNPRDPGGAVRDAVAVAVKIR